MTGLLWLLLPIAAASGWIAARRSGRRISRTPRGTLSEDYIKGLNFLLNEQSDRALEVFIQMVDVDADTVETHLILGSLFRRRGEVDRAIRIHQNLIARPNLEPAQRANALMELGRDYMRAGVLDRAEGLFRELINTGYQRAEGYARLRDLYEQEKEWEKAIWAAEHLGGHTTDSQSVRIAHYCCELGEQAARNGDPSSAARHARRALANDRDSVRASILLGDLAVEGGDDRRALKHYAHVADQHPDFACLVLERVRELHGRLGDAAGYERFLAQLSRRDNSLATLLARLEALRGQGRQAELDDLLNKELVRERVALPVLQVFLRHWSGRVEDAEAGDVLNRASHVLERYLEQRPVYRCMNCGFSVRTHLWHCPGCHQWSTIKPRELHVERPQTALSH
ncbi:lipopolysaccharide assembly protein LapB [Thioalkalivibrio denitrificans]|uniref:Lipopolysaccharide assembly protein B n=1 Tax=Thioalkalivibrio denitrificans TaxID=108003 RepID=A0A1V3NJF5_9GAMM|nr:lipopolysaccharide assembly protein LapB [Thioalkalivibrio denitrificans]OOG25190.1 lipopolysaccharide assembly protein LapB [Thioalkalivibrio denitrificans]